MKLKDFFHILSGDDRSIIRQCSQETQDRFALIGALVACVIVVSFISVTGAFIHFFDFILFDIVIGVFFALMIANIYILLLYTLSKNLLPHISSQGAKWSSVILRMAFIGVFAMIVSKPFELLFFNSMLENDIAVYKQTEYQNGQAVVNSIYENSFAELEKLIQLGDESANSILETKKAEKEETLIQLKQKIDSSEFYLQQIKILNSKYVFTWLITLLMITLFLSPIYLKYLMDEQNEFYQKKKQIEIQIVLDEYGSFKTKYELFWKSFFSDLVVRPPNKNERMNVVLAEIVQKKYAFEVVFADPPFNTIRKRDARDFLEQKSLKEDLYDG
jgi:hypothetical protein